MEANAFIVKGKVNQMVSFGDRLRAERKRLKLNQADFGALAGVTKQSQMLYEKGSRHPDSEYLSAIADEGVDVNYLLTGQRSVSESDLTPEEQALLSNYRSTPAEKRKSIEDLSEAFAGFKAEDKKENTG